MCSLPAIYPSRGLRGPRQSLPASLEALPRPGRQLRLCLLFCALIWSGAQTVFGYDIKLFAARPRTRECMGHSRALARWPNLLLVATIAIDLYLLFQHGANYSGNRTSPACASQTHPCEDLTQSEPIRLSPELRRWAISQLASHHSKSTLTSGRMTTPTSTSWWCHTCKQWRGQKAVFCHRCASQQPDQTYWQEDKWQEPGEWSAPWRPPRNQSPRGGQPPLSPRGRERQRSQPKQPPKGGRQRDRGSGKGAAKGPPDKGGKTNAALPAPPPSFSSSSIRLEPTGISTATEDSSNKVLENLLSALHKQDKATLSPELVKLLEEQKLASAKNMTKALHQATTRQGTARKTLQKLREDRMVFLSSWDQYMEQLVSMLKTQTAEKEKTLKEFQTKEVALVSTIQTAVQEIADGHSRGQHGAHPGRRGLRRAHASPSPCGDHLSANAGSGFAEFQGDDAALCWQQAEGCPRRFLKRRGDGKARQGGTRGQPEEARRAPGTSFSRLARYFLAFAAFPTNRWSGTAGADSHGAPWTGPVIRLTRPTGRCSDIVGFLHSVRQQIDFISPLAAHLLGLQRAHEARCHALDCGFLEYDPRINPDSPMRWMPGKECFDWSLIEMQCLAADQAVPGAYRRMDSSSVVEPDSGCQSPRLATLCELPINGPETDGECPVAHVGSSVHSVHTTCAFSKQADGLDFRGTSTPARAAPGAKVRFNFAVQFWFPAPFQVTLPPSADQDLKAMAAAAQAEHVGFRSPFPLTQAPNIILQAEHTGSCSPYNTDMPSVPSEDFAIFEDVDCTTCPVAPDLGYRHNCDHFAARGFTSPSGSPKLRCFPASSDVLKDVTNFEGSDLAVEHVGLRSPLPSPSHSSSPFTSSSLVKGGSCRSFPAEGLYPPNGSLALTAVRKKPHANPTLHTRPGTPKHAMPLQGTLGYRVGGMSCTPTPAACVGSALPDDTPQTKVPYSAFDSVVEHRALLADPDWEEWRFVIEAIKSSVFPGNPLGRFMRHHVTGYPTPQVMITPAKRFEVRGSVVFDLRRLECGIEVVDISPGTSIAAVLSRLRKITSFPAFLNAMRSRLLHCTVNDEPATAETILQAEAEVIVFTGSLGSRTDRDAHRPISSAAEPASSSTKPHRPPTPPIPLPAEAAVRR